MTAAASIAVCNATPLAGMSDAEQIDFLRMAGMHPPSVLCRDGAAALLIRRDVTVKDACETQAMRLRELHALLTLLALQSDADPLACNCIGAALSLAEQVIGMHALVFKAVLEEAQPA